jgi:hypothetical protein
MSRQLVKTMNSFALGDGMTIMKVRQSRRFFAVAGLEDKGRQNSTAFRNGER